MPWVSSVCVLLATDAKLIPVLPLSIVYGSIPGEPSVFQVEVAKLFMAKQAHLKRTQKTGVRSVLPMVSFCLRCVPFVHPLASLFHPFSENEQRRPPGV